MANVINTTFKLKRGTAARWVEVNPILQQGEPGFEIDTGKLKVGNGVDSWSALPYVGDHVVRRDNDYNYKKIENTFIPANGEICLVDTARDGLRVKCGDGIHTFAELDYAIETIVIGYYYNGMFYKDLQYTQEIIGSDVKIYRDLTKGALYYFDGVAYQSLTGDGPIPNASSDVPGIMKLYNAMGDKTDGTMTQKAITDELNEKFEISLNLEEETLIFSN